MHIANIAVPKDWTKLESLVNQDFKFVEEKVYYIHNDSSYILYLKNGEDSEDVIRVYSGKTAGYEKETGKDLFVAHLLPEEFPYPPTLGASLSDCCKDQMLIPVGDFMPNETQGAYVFKGTVATRSDLPEKVRVGWVYDIEDEDGMNVGWTGDKWDNMGATFKVDLSPYAKKEVVEPQIAALEEAVALRATKAEVTEALAVKAEASDLNAVDAKLDQEIADNATAHTALSTSISDINAALRNKADASDLDALATKAELEPLATKAELEAQAEADGQVHVALQHAIDTINTDIVGVEENVSANANEIAAIKTNYVKVVDAEENFATKESLADYTLTTTLDTELAEKANNSEVKAKDASLEGRLALLEEQISALKKTDIEAVTYAEGAEIPAMTDVTKDYIITGEVTQALNATGKSVTLKNAEVTNNVRAKLNADAGDIELSNVAFTGAFPKSNGNAMAIVNDAEYINIKDVDIDATCYNALEIGLSANKLAKGINITNCNFNGKFSNNAILIFGTADDCVINIDNCHFEAVSNVLRLSNKTNAKNVTVNITNCTCDYWDTNPLWAGLLICQDYTSGNAENAEANNLFGDGKIKVNVINFVGPNGKLEAPEDIAAICGTGTADQVFYVWDNYRNTVAYDANKYPIINII